MCKLDHRCGVGVGSHSGKVLSDSVSPTRCRAFDDVGAANAKAVTEAHKAVTLGHHGGGALVAIVHFK